MYAGNSVNRYDYVICSNDAYGVIHHIPSKMIVKCSCALAEVLRRGIEQEPVEEYTARYLAERFERDVFLGLSYGERRLTGIDIFMSAWKDTDCFNADTGSYNVRGEMMSEEMAERVISCLAGNYDEVENVTFFGVELEQEYRMITYFCKRLEEELSKTPVYRLAGCFRSIPEEFLHDIEKYRIRLCGSLDSFKGISGCLRNASGEALCSCTGTSGDRVEKIFCEAGAEILSVDPNGDIYPCHAFAGQREWRMGNLCDPRWEERPECRRVRAVLERIKAGCACSRCTARENCLHCTATIALEWNGDFQKACAWKRRCNEYALLEFCKS